VIEYIIGIHSIAAALANNNRKKIRLIATKQSATQLGKVNIPVEIVKSVQEEGERLFRKSKFTFTRIPQNLILVAEATPILSPADLIICEQTKIVALDGVTDIQNGAAILRTAAFYGVDYLIISRKNSFSITPSFTKTSCGALEFVKIVRASNLSKTICSLNSKGVNTIGLSEDGQTSGDLKRDGKVCLVLGSEEEGISFAVDRVLSNHFALVGQGKVTTLNVSVAAAIAMQLFFC
jgi:23S rRNA (guanosine2251-2'-O)-methyltransferase